MTFCVKKNETFRYFEHFVLFPDLISWDGVEYVLMFTIIDTHSIFVLIS